MDLGYINPNLGTWSTKLSDGAMVLRARVTTTEQIAGLRESGKASQERAASEKSDKITA